MTRLGVGALKGLKRKVHFTHILKLTLPITPSGKSGRVPVVLLGPEDIRRLEQRVPYHSAVPMEQRLGAGDRCYAVLTDTEDVGAFIWVASRREVYVYEIQDTVWVPESVAYFYDAFTFPEVRGRGLIAQIICGITVELKGSSIQRCEAWIAKRNTASRRAFGKGGFRVYGSWWGVVVGPVRVCFGEPLIRDS